MGITHVLRGEDLLSSTPRQIALYRALVAIGVATRVPLFGHLPLVLGEGNKKLSKRDPQSNLFLHRDRGFIREGLLNYLALLGWSIADDHDVFTLEEMVGGVRHPDVNANPARFDLKKAEAINADHIRRLAPEDFTARLVPYLQRDGVLPAEPVRRAARPARRHRGPGAEAGQRAVRGHADGGLLLPGRRRAAGGRRRAGAA